MGKNIVVVGAQWGDEGKGKIVDLLTDRISAVARFQCLIGNGVVLSLPALMQEMDRLVENGVPVFERLRISPACPLILPSHVALDLAREKARGASAIGTTGRGIGPAYEDKVARRALRVSDLFLREKFAARLGEILDYHNFVLKHYFRAETIDFSRTLDEAMQLAQRVAPLVADVTGVLHDLHERGENILFEGAQGTLLDIDHGTYPYVTSSNTVAAAASTGTGVGPRSLDYILGIVKAYTTRVGAGPFPTELFDDMGEHLGRVGAEFGATTGRPRRCGWFDAVALRRSIINNGISGLCITKLDVLDELETIRICVGYRIDGEVIATPPVIVDRYAEVEPVYEDMPGWRTSTVGVTDYDALPKNARDYLARIESIVETPIDIVSTGPGREQTILHRDPLQD